MSNIFKLVKANKYKGSQKEKNWMWAVCPEGRYHKVVFVTSFPWWTGTWASMLPHNARNIRRQSKHSPRRVLSKTTSFTLPVWLESLREHKHPDSSLRHCLCRLVTLLLSSCWRLVGTLVVCCSSLQNSITHLRSCPLSLSIIFRLPPIHHAALFFIPLFLSLVLLAAGFCSGCFTGSYWLIVAMLLYLIGWGSVHHRGKHLKGSVSFVLISFNGRKLHAIKPSVVQ